MTAMPVKFNVIIPTRDRPDTLRHALRTVVDQSWPHLAIIVSDNCSDERTRAVVESFADPRITYINTGRRVSMSHNWEFALGHVTDGWVTFLGDDDGLLPGALERIAEVIAATGVGAVMSQWRFYFWPGSHALHDQLAIPCGTGYEVRDSKAWLRRLMDGEVDYHELPYVYTGGFADVRLLDAARSEEGPFFRSLTPDVYSAIVLASTTDRYVMLREPVSVMGVSAHSNGASNFSDGGSKEAGNLFFSEDNIPFHPALGSPRVKSIQIIVYECYLQAQHVHQDALRISFERQLTLALSRAAPQDYPALQAYCDGVVAKNPQLAPLPPRARQLALHRWGNWVYRVKALLRQLDDLPVDAAAYHVRDVHGAVRLASHLHRYETRDRHWRLRAVLRFVARRLGWRRP
jgi:glycosyltransferase involved in cell wall biosynthesis